MAGRNAEEGQAMITYQEDPQGKGPGIVVRLDGKIVGSIMKVQRKPATPSSGYGDGWAYRPKGGLLGEIFPTVAQVKKSLEGE